TRAQTTARAQPARARYAHTRASAAEAVATHARAFGGALRQTAWQSAATPSKPARTSRPAITSAPNSVAPSQIARGLFDPAARAAHSAHTSVHATPIGRS